MAEIFDGGDSWKLVLNTEATPLPPNDKDYPGGVLDEWVSKGYRAVLGMNSEGTNHVVMQVEYDKKRNTLDTVAEKVEQLRTCGRCSTLDKERLNLQSIHLTEPRTVPAVNGNIALRAIQGTGQDNINTNPAAPGPVVAAGPAPNLNTGNPMDFKNMFADMFFDAYLTTPGKYFMATMMGDGKMMDQVLPKNETELARFMDEMMGFMVGDIDIMRSPEEAREFLDALRTPKEEQEPSGAAGRAASLKKKRKNISASSVVIY